MGQTLEHIAVIPDGNRRWARNKGQSAEASYRPAIGHLSWLIEHLWPDQCSTISFWWGSVVNLMLRPQEQIDEIYESLLWWLKTRAEDVVNDYQCAISLVGRWEEFYPELKQWIPDPPSNPERQLNILFAYDGRDEIRAAADSLSGGGDTEADFENALWMASSPQVDLVLRTGSIGHLSAGFLVWWIANAHIAFTETLWPDMQDDELSRLIACYKSGERRLGR